MRLEAHGISIELGSGWEGRIRRHPEGASTLHAGNFPLPPADGDFGTIATRDMGPRHMFLALTEYLPGAGLAAGEGLFAESGPPRRLGVAQFSERALVLARPGQAGLQRFFTSAGRPFCLYVVLGSGADGRRLRELNRTLRSLRAG